MRAGPSPYLQPWTVAPVLPVFFLSIESPYFGARAQKDHERCEQQEKIDRLFGTTWGMSAGCKLSCTAINRHLTERGTLAASSIGRGLNARLAAPPTWDRSTASLCDIDNRAELLEALYHIGPQLRLGQIAHLLLPTCRRHSQPATIW
jgi:hypothetical protein